MLRVHREMHYAKLRIPFFQSQPHQQAQTCSCSSRVNFYCQRVRTNTSLVRLRIRATDASSEQLVWRNRKSQAVFAGISAARRRKSWKKSIQNHALLTFLRWSLS